MTRLSRAASAAVGFASIACLGVPSEAAMPSAAQAPLASPLRLSASPRALNGTGVRVSLDQAAFDAIKSRSQAFVHGFPLEQDRLVDLDLHRVDVFAPDAAIVVARLDASGRVVERPLPRPDVTLLAGQVIGDPESRAFLSFGPGGIQGYVQSAGQRFTIASGPFGRGLDTLVYNADALPDQAMNWKDFGCAMGDLGPVANPPSPPGAAGGVAGAPVGPPPCRQVQIAVETDAEYTANLFGGDLNAAAAYVATLLGASSEIYLNELNTRFQITWLRLWDSPADPWTQTNTTNQLFEYRDYWVANMMNVPRSLGHFLSGRALGGGVAWLSVVCDQTFGFGLSANLAGSFPYPLQDHSPQNWDIMVVSHELGHNFGTPHTHDYSPPIDGCGLGDCSLALQGTIMSYCHTCSGGMSNISLTLHPIVDQTILNYLASGLTCDLTGATLPPHAATDFATTSQDSPITIDVLANDLELNCDAVTMTAFDAASEQGGDITLSPGTGPGGRDELTYAPAAGFSGIDTFTYAIQDAQSLSAIGSVQVDVRPLLAADAPSQTQSGVKAAYYALPPLDFLPDFSALSPISAQTLPQVNIPSTNGVFAGSGLADNVGAVVTGYLVAPTTGFYTLYLESDDGSKLWIGDSLIVNNDGLHSMVEKSGPVGLQAGLHRVRIEFFERGGGAGLISRYAGPGISKQVIPTASWLRTVPADVNESGSVDIDDLFAVINAWGPCPTGVACAADINGNGQIDIDDLFAVINSWG